MLSYLTSESAFLRSLGNRCLLLLFLCALTRAGQVSGNASLLGVSIAISQGVIIVGGPILAALFLLSIKLEADNLELARREILDEIRGKTTRKHGGWLQLLFFFPTAAAIFFVAQFYTDLVPASEQCAGYDHLKFLYDFALQNGFPSKFCIHDIKENMPWIYPPLQLYLYILMVVACSWMSWSLTQQWSRFR